MAFKKRLLPLTLILGLTASSLIGCSKPSSDVVVTTRTSQVLSSNLEKEMNFARAIIELTNNQTLEEKDFKLLAERSLEYLITTEVLNEEGVAKKLNATDEDVTKELEIISEFLDQNDTYKQALKASGFTEDYIKETISRSLTADSCYEELYKHISISEADVEEYYNENKSTLYSQEYADASHILIKTVDDNMQPLSDEKKADAKKKAEDILKKVESGEDFNKLAKEYSEDTSASNGGELGKFSRGQMVQEFEDASFALEPGKTSKIVETMYGYHIIKLNDKGTETLDYDDISSNVRADLINDLLSKKIDELKKKYNVKTNSEAVDLVIKNLKPLKYDTKKDDNKDNSDSKESTTDSSNTTESTNTSNVSAQN